MNTLPILYNDEKKRKWKVWVEENEGESFIYRTDGLTSKNFEKKPSVRKIEGKGKKTSHEQALFEAKKYWIKKLEGNFKPLPSDEEGQRMYKEVMELKNAQGGSTRGIASHKDDSKNPEPKSEEVESKDLSSSFVKDVKKIDPMLAHEYSDKKEKVIWDNDEKTVILKKTTLEKFKKNYFDATDGAFIQPKLDGIRNIAFLDTKSDSVVVCSRNAKQFMFLNEQKKELHKFLKFCSTIPSGRDLVLDGEWYVHEPVVDGVKLTRSKTFNFISSCCKTNLVRPNKNERLIQYYVFDIIDPLTIQIDRYKRLTNLISLYNSENENLKYIVHTIVDVVESEDQMKEFHNKYYEQGYEGIMLRDPNGMYQNKRSLYLLKYKNFYDAEFLIIGAEQAKGTREGDVVWVCQTENGTKFTCMMKDIDSKTQKEYYNNYIDYLGEKLTVKYQDLGENGVPRFPTGIAIRSYE